jgi:hypothetical protein
MVHIVDTVASSTWRSHDPRVCEHVHTSLKRIILPSVTPACVSEITRPTCYLDLAAFAAADMILIPKRLSASTMSFM